MRSLIGGNLFTVNDDVHADAAAVPDCAARGRADPAGTPWHRGVRGCLGLRAEASRPSGS
jgi:hypothetical protein